MLCQSLLMIRMHGTSNTFVLKCTLLDLMKFVAAIKSRTNYKLNKTQNVATGLINMPSSPSKSHCLALAQHCQALNKDQSSNVLCIIWTPLTPARLESICRCNQQTGSDHRPTTPVTDRLAPWWCFPSPPASVHRQRPCLQDPATC